MLAPSATFVNPRDVCVTVRSEPHRERVLEEWGERTHAEAIAAPHLQARGRGNDSRGIDSSANDDTLQRCTERARFLWDRAILPRLHSLVCPSSRAMIRHSTRVRAWKGRRWRGGQESEVRAWRRCGDALRVSFDMCARCRAGRNVQHGCGWILRGGDWHGSTPKPRGSWWAWIGVQTWPSEGMQGVCTCQPGRTADVFHGIVGRGRGGEAHPVAGRLWE